MSVYEPHFWGDLWYEVFPGEDRPEENERELALAEIAEVFGERAAAAAREETSDAMRWTPELEEDE